MKKIISLLCIIISCKSGECDDYINLMISDHFNIILKEKNTVHPFDIRGIDAESQRYVQFRKYYYKWVECEDEMTPGDTIVKYQGKMTIEVHKKDEILYCKCECGGVVYD